MINTEHLCTELIAAGLPGTISVGWQGPQDEPDRSYHTRPDGVVRIVWPATPTPAQVADADVVIQAHDPAAIEVAEEVMRQNHDLLKAGYQAIIADMDQIQTASTAAIAACQAIIDSPPANDNQRTTAIVTLATRLKQTIQGVELLSVDLEKTLKGIKLLIGT